ncbi:hypothetical protein [Pontibacter pamirensis]|uniref:hypothetical protein n=1 Tax=Pontibacter pamirensis TaxID=2562824 RepID=UPI00138A2577|nr:hypothetical protein [Pontibacter pamirensis]
MKRVTLLAAFLLAFLSGVKANDLNNDLVELAKIYRNFMFRNSPTESTYAQLKGIKSAELASSAKFIKETITSKNRLAETEFLKLPDEETLKYVYIIKLINWNIREEKPRDNVELISELTEKEVPRYELIDSYYDMLFSGIGNKNQPFDLSGINFSTSEYDFRDDTEKGIFFLKAMNLCGTVIWGYMNVVNPQNHKAALENIEKYPRFNGQPYYQYLDFGFPDFEMEIEEGKGVGSYKAYYINKYYDTLLSHLAILSQKKKDRERRTDLILGSILKEKNYYRYSKKKNELEALFTTVER